MLHGIKSVKAVSLCLSCSILQSQDKTAVKYIFYDPSCNIKRECVDGGCNMKGPACLSFYPA